MKLVSWNVNGLRAVLRKNFLDYLEAEKPDLLCLQETKCSPDDESNSGQRPIPPIGTRRKRKATPALRSSPGHARSTSPRASAARRTTTKGACSRPSLPTFSS